MTNVSISNHIGDVILIQNLVDSTPKLKRNSTHITFNTVMEEPGISRPRPPSGIKGTAVK